MSRRCTVVAFAIALAFASGPTSAETKGGDPSHHPTATPAPWYSSVKADVKCAAGDPIVDVELSSAEYSPAGSGPFACTSAAVAHGFQAPPSVARGWHLSITGPAAWNAPQIQNGAGYISNTGYVLYYKTITMTRPNTSQNLTQIAPLPSTHSIIAQNVDDRGNIYSSQTFYCVQITQYFGSGQPQPESMVHFISGGVESWIFQATLSGPPNGLTC